MTHTSGDDNPISDALSSGDNVEPASIKELWHRFNVSANQLSIALGRTSNIVGKYAERLANEYYQGRLLRIYGASADIETPDGKRYQVKSRKIMSSPTTQLGVIRSWDVDFRVVILFGEQPRQGSHSHVQSFVVRQPACGHRLLPAWLVWILYD